MYNYTIVNGQRPVLGVEVTLVDKAQKAIWVKGTQFDKDRSQWIEIPIALRVGPFAEPKLDKIQVGDTILAKVIFDEGRSDVATCDEIGIKGDTIITYNKNNNKKYVTYSKVNGIKVFNKKDGTGKLSLQLSFKNPLNAKDGTYLGTVFEKTNDEGKTISSYWLNSSMFYDSKFESSYTAEKAESEIGNGDTIICVTAESPNKNDPTKMNYSCNKFIVLEKAAPAPAVVSNPFPEIPGIKSPVASAEQMLNQAALQPQQATPTPQPQASAPAPVPTPAPQQAAPQVAPMPQQMAPTPAPIMPQATPQVVTPVALVQPQQATPVVAQAPNPTPITPVAPVQAQPVQMAAPTAPVGMPINLANQLPFN